jgi:hypothetical protein
MALSKAETRAAIATLSKDLGVEPPANLEQLDKLETLTPLLEALQAQAAGKKSDDPIVSGVAASSGVTTETPGIGAPPPPPSEIEPAAPKKVVATTYVVNEGKMVTTKRGTIGALEHVWPDDFGGGQRDLDHWVTHSYVTKTDHFAK